MLYFNINTEPKNKHIFNLKSAEWQNGLFSCCENIGECFFAWLCSPCYDFTVATASGNTEQSGLICGCIVCHFPPGKQNNKF